MSFYLLWLVIKLPIQRYDPEKILQWNFKDLEKYDKMWTIANQPAKLFVTAKVYISEKLDDTKYENPKFRPIIDHTRKLHPISIK